jgi:hypothetical protein
MNDHYVTPKQATAFLEELTELSKKHDMFIGLSQDNELCLIKMNKQDHDAESRYVVEWFSDLSPEPEVFWMNLT